MNSQKTIPVFIRSNRGQTSQGTVQHLTFEKKERMRRGLKALGISWGLAVGAVLIPILHFILVPLLLLAGPIAFFFAAGQEEIILGGTGKCPECKLDFDIVRSNVKWPIFTLCKHCKEEVRLEPYREGV